MIRAERLRHHSATDRAVPRSEASSTVGAPDLVRVRATVRVWGTSTGRVGFLPLHPPLFVLGLGLGLGIVLGMAPDLVRARQEDTVRVLRRTPGRW